MRISAKSDYAIRALLELGSCSPGSLKAEQIAARQQIPGKFLENILLELRCGGFVCAHRGINGGYWISRPADRITLAEVLEALDGPLVTIHGSRVDEVSFPGVAGSLRDAWGAAERALRGVLGQLTLADVIESSGGEAYPAAVVSAER